MKVEIRKAKKTDLKKIADIMRIEYSRHPYNEKWKNHEALSRIKYYYKHNTIFVALYKNEITGFITIGIIPSYVGLRGFIEDFVVIKNFQNKGIGKNLFTFAEKYFINKKVKKISLLSHNKSKAYRIYKKKGYKDSGWALMIKKLK